MVAFYSVVFTYPFDIAHTKLAMDCTQLNRYRKIVSVWDYFSGIKKSQLMKKLYQGVFLQLLASVIYTIGISFGFYQSNKFMEENKKFTAILLLMQSALIMEVLVYPLDTLKRCYQVEEKSNFRNFLK